MARPRSRLDPKKTAKLRFSVDRDASATAETLATIGWRGYHVDPRATDEEIIKEALQKGRSIISMDADYSRFGLPEIPFTVILGGSAQRSESTATAQILQLRQLIGIGEIQPSLHQRVTMSRSQAKIEILDGNSPRLRTIHLGSVSKRKRR